MKLTDVRMITASIADVGIFIACIILAVFLFSQLNSETAKPVIDAIMGSSTGTVL